MKKVKRIPLNLRLQMAGTNIPNFLAVFEVFVDDYFEGLTQISENSYFTKVYHNQSSKINCSQDVAILLTEMPHVTDSFPRKEGIEMMYEILVEPFALINKNIKEGKTYESLFNDA